MSRNPLNSLVRWIVQGGMILAIVVVLMLLLLSGCASLEKPIINTIEVEKPVPVPCPIDAPKPPEYLEHAKGKSVLEKGNAAISETEELRALYDRVRLQADACNKEVERLKVPPADKTTKEVKT